MNKSRKFYYWLGALLILASTRPAVAIDTVPLSEEGGTTPPPAATSSSPVVWEITVREGGAWQAEGNATIAPQSNAGGSLRAGDQLASLAEQLHQAGLFAHGPVVQFEIAGRVESSQSFTLTLPCNPSTGYIWQPSLAADTPLRVSQTPVSIISQSNLRGAPAFCVFEVQATADGIGRLAMIHRRPWLADAPVQAIVRVQAAAAGPGLDELAGALSWPVIVQPAQLPQHESTPASAEAMTNDPPSDGQSVQALPSRFNWCERGVCPPVRDQGQCGSCWAFSAVGVMDIVARIARPGAQPDFSEQFLVSCNYRGWGCNGGWIALDMFVDRRVWRQPMAGPVAERFFPYAAQDLPCGGPYPQSWQGRAWDTQDQGTECPHQIKSSRRFIATGRSMLLCMRATHLVTTQVGSSKPTKHHTKTLSITGSSWLAGTTQGATGSSATPGGRTGASTGAASARMVTTATCASSMASPASDTLLRIWTAHGCLIGGRSSL